MTQPVNIVYLLLCHLNRYLWFEIPGLGIFNGTKTASQVNHIEQKIFPGKIDIEFISANTLRSETMIQNLILETGFDQELLEEHLAALCQHINESLKSNQFYEFIPFGSLKNQNGILIFNQSQNNIHQDFYWMEPLPIVPVELPHEEITFPVEVIPNKKTKSKKELTILLIALGILWILFLSLLCCPPASKNHKPESKIQKTDTVNSSTAFDTMNKPKDTIKPKVSLPQQNKDTLVNTADSVNHFNNEIVVDSANVKELDGKIKNKPCIIIVGSFIKLTNAEKLSVKVKANGYEVYRGDYGKFHRVGIQFNCFKHDLKEMLAELKKQFHPDAWVLKF